MHHQNRLKWHAWNMKLHCGKSAVQACPNYSTPVVNYYFFEHCSTKTTFSDRNTAEPDAFNVYEITYNLNLLSTTHYIYT